MVIDCSLLKERREQMKSPFNTKRKMAEILDIDENLIKAYEEGTKYPSLKTFKKLCLYLQLSADELLGFEEDNS
jgi:transcriptional regulator with XRE-family HTH domain